MLFSFPQEQRWKTLLVALLAPLAAAGLRHLLIPLIGSETIFLTEFPTIMMVSYFLGFVPGLLSCFVGTLAGYAWVAPGGITVLENPVRLVEVVFLLGSSFGLSFLAGRERRYRRTTERTIQEGRDLYEAISRNLPGCAVLVVNQGLEILAADGPLLATLGYGELRGKNLRSFALTTSSEGPARLDARFHRVFAGEQDEAVFPFAGRVVLAQYCPLNMANEGEKRALIIVRDITEIHEARQCAERANLAKSRFLAAMSHEIRTPLNAIIGFSELLSCESIDDGERRSFIESIGIASRHLLALVNDLLDISRIESGRMKVSCGAFCLRKACEETAASIESLAHKKAIEISLEFGSELPQEICSDETRVRQLLLNLMTNAVKFTERGKVFVRVESKDSSFIRVTVEDTGRGISPELVPRLFEPFMQSQEEVTRPRSGAGLGLYLSREIARALGGEVSLLWTSLGRGSAFELTLPTRGPECMAS